MADLSGCSLQELTTPNTSGISSAGSPSSSVYCPITGHRHLHPYGQQSQQQQQPPSSSSSTSLGVGQQQLQHKPSHYGEADFTYEITDRRYISELGAPFGGGGGGGGGGVGRVIQRQPEPEVPPPMKPTIVELEREFL